MTHLRKFRLLLFSLAPCALVGALAAAALCGLSRVALMTGRAPASTGIHDNGHWFCRVPSLRGLVSQPQAMQRDGYRTIGAGKLYHPQVEGGQPRSEFQETAEPTNLARDGRSAQVLAEHRHWLPAREAPIAINVPPAKKQH
jgi:arylsulfatase A-like enzyme